MKNNKTGIHSIKKWNSILEKVWLAIAIVISILSIIIGFVDQWEGVMIYFLLSGLAWGVFLIRRGMRIRLDKTTSTLKN